MNQNKGRVWLNESVSLRTLRYITFTLANLSYSRKVQGQKGCDVLFFQRRTME